MTDQNNSLQTDVALIKKDIKQVERFFVKFDSALNSMTEIATQVAVQGEILKNTVEKLDGVDERIALNKKEDLSNYNIINSRLEEYRKSAYADHEKLAAESRQNRKERNEEIMTQLAKMNGALEARLVRLDDRIKLLEQWKWYIMGLGATVIVIVTNIEWSKFLG